MTQRYHSLRPAMTAIAAVIALSSTTTFAQSAEIPAPIVETSPAPAPQSPDPLAPDVSPSTSTPEPVASETTVAPVTTAPPAERASRPAARTTTPRTASVTRARAAAPVAADVATPAAPTPIDPLLVPPEMAAPAPVAVPAEPASEAAPVASDQMTIEEALPYAGAAGLVLLALAGTGIAVSRRRRRREDAIQDAKRQQIIDAPEIAFESDQNATPTAMVEPAPTFVRAPARVEPDPVPAAASTAASTLPVGFDTSRFGQHVQAAYAGPTPDNPSASLKRRLTVAHFLDQKDDVAVASAPEHDAINSSTTKTAANPAWAKSADGDFMFRRDDKPPSAKPVFHK